MNGLASLECGGRRTLGGRKFAQEMGWRREFGNFANSRVVDGPGGTLGSLDSSLVTAGDGGGHGSDS
jgi:hypothetical protein